VELIKNILGDDSNRKFKQRIEPMGSLLEIEDEIVKPFHKSIIEWVNNEETEAEFYIDPKEGHQIILNYGWSLYESGNSAIPGYFLAYLPPHLHTLKRIDLLSKLLTDFKYFETNYEIGVEGIYKLMKAISDISMTKDMPIKEINLASSEGLNLSKDSKKESLYIAAKAAILLSVCERLLIELNSEFRFGYSKFKTGSGCFFNISQSEDILSIAYDNTITLYQILNNYSHEDYTIEEKFMVGKLEKLKIDQKELMENLYEKRKDMKKQPEDYVISLLKFILSNLECIDGISVITYDGLPVCSHNRTDRRDWIVAAIVAQTFSLWERQGAEYGFADLEYIIIAGDKGIVILLPCGTQGSAYSTHDYVISISVGDELEFYRHLNRYTDYFKNVVNSILILLNVN